MYEVSPQYFRALYYLDFWGLLGTSRCIYKSLPKNVPVPIQTLRHDSEIVRLGSRGKVSRHDIVTQKVRLSVRLDTIKDKTSLLFTI